MQKQTHGGDIYSASYRLDFSSNINPFGMPESVIKAVQEGVKDAIHYPDVQYRELRRAISEAEGTKEDCIICGNGAAEIIFALALAKKPKTGLLTAPGFAEYEQALRTIDCQITFYECRKEAGYAVGEDYLDYLDENPEIAFLCNPNNPTGLLVEGDLLDRIIEKCHRKNILLVLDECFLNFVEDSERLTKKEYINKTPNLFILKAFTKMYGMPGLRLGYGLCSDRSFLDKMRRVLQPWNVSIPAQCAGIAALKEKQFVQRTRAYVTGERAYMAEELKKLGFEVYDSRANYIFFRGWEDLYDVCFSEGLIVRDCSNYRGLGKGYYRIAIKLREENDELLATLKKYYK